MPILIFSQSDYLIQIFYLNSHNSNQCRARSTLFAKEDISGLSRTRVNNTHEIVCKASGFTYNPYKAPDKALFQLKSSDIFMKTYGVGVH